MAVGTWGAGGAIASPPQYFVAMYPCVSYVFNIYSLFFSLFLILKISKFFSIT